MRYAFKIGTRYLTASLGQSVLLVAGVAVGVFVFIFMSALIGGLAELLVSRTIGDVAHVTIEAAERQPGSLFSGEGRQVLLVRQKSRLQRDQLRSASAFLPAIAAMPGVAAVSPQVTGNGFLVQGQATAPVAVTGVEPAKVSAIADFEKRMVSGGTGLTGSTILVGKRLADDLGLAVGGVVRLRASTNDERVMRVSGVFEIGIEALDRRAAFVSLSTARSLFDLPQGINRIELKLTDVGQAENVASRISLSTGLAATPWTADNAQLLDGLRAQATTGYVIQSFALATITIGIASALMLSTYRRRPEIGIMRAMGASRRFVVAVFVTQGTLIGVSGGLLGAAVGYAALLPFPPPGLSQGGGLPIDIGQGAYGPAILFTVLSAALASILPARAAARVDPVQAIAQ